MGAQSLFCCFKNQTPNCISLFVIVINIISIVLMVWSFIDVEFFKTTSKVLYIISFILLCLGLIFFVIIFFFFKLKRAQNSKTVYSTGRCLWLTIIALCALAPVLIVIGFVINLLEYLQWEEDNPSKTMVRPWMGRLICTSNIQFFSTNYFRSLRECFIQKIRTNHQQPFFFNCWY